MNNRESVELNEDGIPLVNAFDEFASKHLTKLIILFFFLAPIAISQHFTDIVMQSPLVKFTSNFAGFLSSLIAWVPAYLIAGIVIGKFWFAKHVFMLYGLNDYSAAMSLVLLLIPIEVFFIRTINRTVLSYQNRKILFLNILIFAITSLILIFQHLIILEFYGVYLFGCTVTGIVYFLLISKIADTTKIRIKQARGRGFKS